MAAHHVEQRLVLLHAAHTEEFQHAEEIAGALNWKGHRASQARRSAARALAAQNRLLAINPSPRRRAPFLPNAAGQADRRAKSSSRRLSSRKDWNGGEAARRLVTQRRERRGARASTRPELANIHFQAVEQHLEDAGGGLLQGLGIGQYPGDGVFGRQADLRRACVR